MIKKNYKIIIGFILGLIVSSISVYAATLLSSREVSYDNSESGGNSNNVQGAIEELYEKANRCTTGSCSLTESNFVIGYTYNQNKNANNYCMTGDQVTCERTDCYTSSAKTCPPGTIIDYIVSGNKNNKVRFHVMYDNGRTLTMQSQKNTVRNIAWNTSNNTTQGPLTILAALESATKNWENVESQTYQMGTTDFNGTNSYTGCSRSETTRKITCDRNIYTLGIRTSKARMLTAQEAASLGCLARAGNESKMTESCPSWMNNFLSTVDGYTPNFVDDSKDSVTGDYNRGYWTMSAATDTAPWVMNSWGEIAYGIGASTIYAGARAVVVVNK